MTQAVTVDRSHIFISKDATLFPRNIAGHEAFHLWKSGTVRDSYIEILEDNLLFSSEAFREYQTPIAEAYLGGEADLANDAQMDKMREEIFAYISGDIHEGTNEDALRPMFRDFDAVQAAWEQLVEENRGGTTRSKYSLKEDGDHGRTREETRGAFLRRAAGAGYAVYEGETAGAYGYRRVDRESARENAGQIQAEISNLGIEADIISGPILINRNGKTIERPVSHAVTIDRARILVNENSTLPPRNVAGHEAFHLWKSGVGRDAYIETVEDNLDFTSDDFRNYQSAVSYTLFGEEADLNDDRQMARLREELFAYISGDIHEGANEANLRPMFRDFDAVRTAWETLVEENRSAQARESRKGFSVDRELDREIRKIVKEAREGGRSEEAVQADVRALVRKLTGAEKKAAQTAEEKLSAALEAGAKRAETLQERQGDGTMETTRNSLKEDVDHGRTREETGAEFERRCLEEGYQVLAGADTRYGYRGVRSAGEAARQVQAELERLGVPCFVKEGAVLKNNGTTTVVLKSPQATTLSVGRIAIDNSITLPPKNVAGHEAFNFWKGLDGRDSYTETVLENLDFTSEAFQEYQSSISRVMFQGEVDLSNQGQFDQLMEEIFAYISGDIHEGTNETMLRPMFRDFDAVQSAWETLVEENRSRTARSRYSRKDLTKEEEGALLRYKSGESYQINAKLRDGVSLTEMEQQFVDQLDTALEKMPLHDGTVYRRLSFDMEGQEVLEAFLAEHEAGEIVGYSAYTSSSVSESGYPVDGEPTVTQIIESHTGRDLEGVGNNFEREVLFPRQSYFYIQSVEVDNRGNTIIHMEEVTENGAGQLYSEERGRTVQQVRPEKSDQMQNVSGRDSQESSVQQPMSGLRAEGDGEEGGITRESRKGFSVDRELDQEIRQIVKEAREGGRSEEAVQADIRALVQESYQRMAEQYGTIPAGERPAREARVPRRTAEDRVVSQTVRTVLEAGATPETAIPNIEELTARGVFSYTRYTDKQAMEDAEGVTRDIIGQTGINKLERETHIFQVEGGTVTLSTAQIMSLYELMKREQAQERIFIGGIRPETILGQRGIRESRKSASVRVTAEDLSVYISDLKDRTTQSSLQKIFSVYCVSFSIQ